MSRVEAYRETLRALDDWDAFLLSESGLPGPRGNIELARAVAEEGDEALFRRYLTWDAEAAPTQSPYEFLAFCGVLGLGRLLAEGRADVLDTLREHASDPRWRVREAVAMALQRWGAADMDGLLEAMQTWARGDLLERRAAAAAVCEPALLGEARHVEQVLALLDDITASMLAVEDRKNNAFKALRKGMGYCWSVAAAALPEQGKAAMERWFGSDDPDVRWMMRQNLSKKRLSRADGEWVARWKAALSNR